MDHWQLGLLLSMLARLFVSITENLQFENMSQNFKGLSQEQLDQYLPYFHLPECIFFHGDSKYSIKIEISKISEKVEKKLTCCLHIPMKRLMTY